MRRRAYELPGSIMKRIVSIGLLILWISAGCQAQLINNEQYRQHLDEQYASGLFRDRNSIMLVPADDRFTTGKQNIFQYLQGRIAGLIITIDHRLCPMVSWRSGTTTLYLDETRIDAAMLQCVNLNDIGLIKIFRPPFMGASGNGAGGAIAVYTLKDEDE